MRIAIRLPCALVPQHHRAAAILALGDSSFKVAIVERMVFDHDCHALLLGIEAWAPCDGPALQHAVELEAEIEMKARGVVLLDKEGVAFAARDLAARLGRRFEIALAAIGGET